MHKVSKYTKELSSKEKLDLEEVKKTFKEVEDMDVERKDEKVLLESEKEGLDFKGVLRKDSATLRYNDPNYWSFHRGLRSRVDSFYEIESLTIES